METVTAIAGAVSAMYVRREAETSSHSLYWGGLLYSVIG